MDRNNVRATSGLLDLVVSLYDLCRVTAKASSATGALCTREHSLVVDALASTTPKDLGTAESFDIIPVAENTSTVPTDRPPS